MRAHLHTLLACAGEVHCSVRMATYHTAGQGGVGGKAIGLDPRVLQSRSRCQPLLGIAPQQALQAGFPWPRQLPDAYGHAAARVRDPCLRALTLLVTAFGMQWPGPGLICPSKQEAEGDLNTAHSSRQHRNAEASN